ncbi:MAG: sigma-70 family RNA polymerase sigma factor [Acidobacteriota bacterium]
MPAIALASHDGAGAVPMTSADASTRLEELFREASALVYRTAMRVTGSTADAEDVLQSVFLHLMRSCPPSPWPDKPIGYVHRAAVNASLDLLRRRKRWTESGDETELPSRSDRGEEEALLSHLQSERDAGRLRQAMTALSALEAEVFTLRFFEEKQPAEIAEILGKTSNHVRVTLHAARKKVKSQLLDSNETACEEIS